MLQLNLEDCVGVGCLIRGGGESMFRGPEAREIPSCLVT